MKPLKDAKFLIKKEDGSYQKELTTDENGEIDLSKLDPGVYTVQEVAAPAGYQIDNSIRTIEIRADENATFVFTNTEKPNMKIIKMDAASGAKLKDATFRIAKIADGTRYLDRVTDENGEILIEDLDEGIYSVQEILPPPGYQLNDREYHVELSAGHTSELIVENSLRPKLKILKYDYSSKQPLADATFEVWRDAALVGTYTTNGKGEILLTNLEPGTYMVKEIAVDDAHTVDSTPRLAAAIPRNSSLTRTVKSTSANSNPAAIPFRRLSLQIIT